MKKRLLILIGLLLSIVGLGIPATAQSCGAQVTVQSGDTLWDIARDCDVTVPAILEANFNIFEPSQLDVGQVVTIPSNNVARAPQVNVYPVSIRAGDSIQIIANGFPLTTDVQVSIGQDRSEPSVTQILETDRQGALVVNMTIPPTADLNGRWVAIVETIEGQAYQARSFAFFIDEETTQAPPVQPTTPPQNVFTQTQIYLIAPETGGSVGCGDSTVPYTVSIEPTVAPLTAALNQLFTIGEQSYGYYNALANSNLTVRDIDIDDGTATIDLVGNLSVAGVCDAPRVEAQIRQTALQYFTIDSVIILVNGQPLEDVLSGR